MIKLLKLKESLIKVLYDFILVIINRLIKYRYFISYKKALSVEELVYTFLRIVTANYELSEEIITDWDKLFIFRF